MAAIATAAAAAAGTAVVIVAKEVVAVIVEAPLVAVVVAVTVPVLDERSGLGAGAYISTFRLNVSTFRGIRWVHYWPPVY